MNLGYSIHLESHTLGFVHFGVNHLGMGPWGWDPGQSFQASHCLGFHLDLGNTGSFDWV